MLVEFDRQMTINMGNFDSVRPAVKISHEINNIDDYKDVSDLMENMMMMETAILIADQTEVYDKGKQKYMKEVFSDYDKIKTNIENCLDKMLKNKS